MEFYYEIASVWSNGCFQPSSKTAHRPTDSIFNFHPCGSLARLSLGRHARVLAIRKVAYAIRTYAHPARHISRHINILYSASYHEDKKHVCSSAYQMLSPSLFVCQLNATSATDGAPRLLVDTPLGSPILLPSKTPTAWQFTLCITHCSLFVLICV